MQAAHGVTEVQLCFHKGRDRPQNVQEIAINSQKKIGEPG